MSSLAEQLEAMKYAPSSTPDEQRKRCPECRSPKVRRKIPGSRGRDPKPGEYSCAKCHAHFDEPLVGSEA